MELSMLAVGLGFILDLLIGDPHWLYHPIRLVGHLISTLETLLRKIFPKTEQGELIAGGFLLVLTAGITSGVAWQRRHGLTEKNWQSISMLRLRRGQQSQRVRQTFLTGTRILRSRSGRQAGRERTTSSMR